MTTLSTGWIGIAKEHETLLDDARLDKSYVLFRKDLAEAFRQAAEALEAARPKEPFLEKGNRPETPLTDMPIDATVLNLLFREILHNLAKYGGQTNSMKKLADAVTDEINLLVQLVKLSIFNWDGQELKTLAGKIDIPYADALFTGRILAVPFLQETVLMTRPRKLDTTGEEYKNCPNCGCPPAFATLKEESGQRQLVCTLCNTDWTFPRIKCPFCGNTDQAKLNVIFADEDKNRRLEVCEECKRYIKTIDERSAGTAVNPFTEETHTLILDLLAEKNGYVNRLY